MRTIRTSLVRVSVATEIDFAVERPTTYYTRERLEARMLSAVRDEVGGLAERLAALRALVRLLARVNVRVLLHVGLLVEALSAERARERARVRVNQHVGGERGGTLERLAALFALEYFLVGVDGFVLFQADHMTERFAAEVARKRSAAGVRPPDVDFQSMRRAEHFLAVQAAERLSFSVERFLLTGRCRRRFRSVRLGGVRLGVRCVQHALRHLGARDPQTQRRERKRPGSGRLLVEPEERPKEKLRAVGKRTHKRWKWHGGRSCEEEKHNDFMTTIIHE